MTRRCIETHPKSGVRCESGYRHRGDDHIYSHMGAMTDPITWPNTAPSRWRGLLILMAIAAPPAFAANYLMLQAGVPMAARTLLLTPIGVIVGFHFGKRFQ